MPTNPLDSSTVPAAGTLRHLLRTAPRVAPDRAARLLAGIARALAVWHARGGTHGAGYGALTPERVLVGPGDVVTLAPPPRQDGAPAPWPTYLAPEQIDGRSGDVRSDVYALGLLGWEMLAGQQPWEGESLYGVVVKQREQDLPRLSTLRPGLPRPLVAALDGCLHKAPGDRWQTVAEFLAVLEPAAPAAVEPLGETPRAPTAGVRAPAAGPVAGAVARAAAAGAVPGAAPEPRPAPPAPPARRPDPPRRRGRWLAGAVLGLALVGAAGAAAVVLQGRNAARATQTWLDSLTTPPNGAAVDVGAAAATTTRENTTAVPVRRSGGAVRAPAPVFEEDTAPPADTAEAPVDPADVPPVLQPTPPFSPPPARPGRPLRPTVPGPDTLAPPDSLARR